MLEARSWLRRLELLWPDIRTISCSPEEQVDKSSRKRLPSRMPSTRFAVRIYVLLLHGRSLLNWTAVLKWVERGKWVTKRSLGRGTSNTYFVLPLIRYTEKARLLVEKLFLIQHSPKNLVEFLACCLDCKVYSSHLRSLLWGIFWWKLTTILWRFGQVDPISW